MPQTRSIKASEIQHFSRFATRWGEPQGPMRLLHQINPVRMAYLRKEILHRFPCESTQNPLNNRHILDVGCGGGLICEPLCRLGATVTGCDAAAGAIETAKRRAEEQDLPIAYYANSVEAVPCPPGSFDVVIAFEVLEHVADILFFLKTCQTFLKPGGLLILSTLNKTTRSYLLGILAAEYILGWIPRGTHTWNQFVTPAEIQWVLDHLGFERLAFRGMVYDLFKQRWDLSPQTYMNYFARAIKPETHGE